MKIPIPKKRALALKPQIIENGSINTQYTKQYDDYFTDNFALRPDFVTLYAIINKAMFNESVSDQVIIGKEGWLFFHTGSKRLYKKRRYVG